MKCERWAPLVAFSWLALICAHRTSSTPNKELVRSLFGDIPAHRVLFAGMPCQQKMVPARSGRTGKFQEGRQTGTHKPSEPVRLHSLTSCLARYPFPWRPPGNASVSVCSQLLSHGERYAMAHSTSTRYPSDSMGLKQLSLATSISSKKGLPLM